MKLEDVLKVKVLLDYFEDANDNKQTDREIIKLVGGCKSLTSVENIRKGIYWQEIETPEYTVKENYILEFEHNGINHGIDLLGDDE